MAASATAPSPSSELRSLLGRLRSLFAPLQRGQLYLARGRNDFKAISSVGGRGDLLTTVRDGFSFGELSEPVHLAPSGRNAHLVSVPILAGSVLIGMIVLERAGNHFDAIETEYLLRIAEQLSYLLQGQFPSLRQRDRVAEDRPDAPKLPQPLAATPRAEPEAERRRRVDRRVAKRPMLTANGLPKYGRRASDRRLGVDMSLARSVQRLFLPQLPSFFPTGPNSGGIQIATEYHPAYEVGGDFYDFIQTGEHRFLGVVGDVSGKGVSAALVMSRREADFRRLAASGSAPGVLLRQLNTIMVEEGHDGMFATALCIELNTERRSLAIANAGHVPLVHRQAHHSGLSFLGLQTGAPLGLVANEEYSTQHFEYGVGDIIVLMTDGISDALDPTSSVDPDSKVLSVIGQTEHNVEYLVPAVLQAARDALQEADDLTLLALQLP